MTTTAIETTQPMLGAALFVHLLAGLGVDCLAGVGVG
jgi:hypothetical protein